MPKRYRSAKSSYRRKAYRSKRRKGFLPRREFKPTAAIIRSPTGFPDRMFVKLTVSGDFEAKFSNTRTPSNVIASGNCIVDPFLASGSVQPVGLDEWANFYYKARVLGSHCKLIVLAGQNAADGGAGTFSTSSSWALWGGIMPSNDGSGFSSQALMESSPRAKVRCMSEYDNSYSKQIMSYCSTATAKGLSPSAVRIEDGLTTLTTGSTEPADEWFWICAVAPTVTSNSAGYDVYIDFKIIITYYVELYSRKVLALS